MNVENWLNEARRKLKKVDKNSPMKIKYKKIRKSENSTPDSCRKGRKRLDVDKKESRINDIRKLWEKQNVNTDAENRRKLDKKIRTRDEISSQKIRNLIDEMKLDNSSVKIVAKSPKPSTPKLQCKLDAWVKKC